jgi:hypothetical protein
MRQLLRVLLFVPCFAVLSAMAAPPQALDIEGGADNDSVYTFSLFHYAVAGVMMAL